MYKTKLKEQEGEKVIISHNDNCSREILLDHNIINYSDNTLSYCYLKQSDSMYRWPKGDNVKYPFTNANGPDTVDIEILIDNDNERLLNPKIGDVHKKFMSFPKFKKIYGNLPPSVARVNLIAQNVHPNSRKGVKTLEEFEGILKYLDNEKVGVNLIIEDEPLSLKEIKLITEYCDNIYVNLNSTEKTYNLVNKLTRHGKSGVHIRMLFCNNTYKLTGCVITSISDDHRLKHLESLNLVSVKPAGRWNMYEPIKNVKKMRAMVLYAKSKDIVLNFDACSACNYVCAVKDQKDRDTLLLNAPPCESGLNQYYIDVHGRGYPCVFCKGLKDFGGSDCIRCENFDRDVWHSLESIRFRVEIIKSKRICPIYNLQIEKLP